MDRWDWLFVLGLAALAAGLAIWHPSIALVVVGLIVMAAALKLAPTRRAQDEHAGE